MTEPIKFKVLSPEDMQKAIINNTDVPMGEAVAKEALKDTLRQGVIMIEGIGNPYNFCGKAFMSHDEIDSNKQHVAFEECRQRIIFTLQQAIEEQDND